ncbi:MAG: glycosyltransferase family 9 protein [Pseudomonadota bacterium]
MFGGKQGNVLVIKTDGLASFVAAEPAFEAIRDAHEGAKISLLTTRALQRIARASPYFDQVAAAPEMRDATARKELVKQLKSNRFAAVYDLSGDDVAKRLFRAMGPFRPKWRSAPAPDKRARKTALHSAPDFTSALTAAGIDAPERAPDCVWALEARKDSANMKPSWYGISGAYGLLLPAIDPEHRWTAEGYAELAMKMADEGFMPVLAGPRELHGLGDDIAEDTPQLVDLTGKTDHLQLAALARDAAFFVSDTADEMRLAISVGCRGVVILKTNAVDNAPSGRDVVILTTNGGYEKVQSSFVWQTLTNMGLNHTTAKPPLSEPAS